MCAGGVHGCRKASFSSVFYQVRIFHHVDCRCVSMMMMVLFAKPKYSSLISSTYCSLMHFTIRLTLMSVAASCSSYFSLLTFCDSWRFNVSNGVENAVIALLTGDGFGIRLMVADESLATVLWSSLSRTSDKDPCFPPHADVFVEVTILAIC